MHGETLKKVQLLLRMLPSAQIYSWHRPA